MASRAIVGLTLLAAIVAAVVPDPALGGMLAILLVVLGLAYAVIALDPENATDFLAVAIAAGAAGGADVLSLIPAVGMYLDGILDGMVSARYGNVAAIGAIRVFTGIKGCRQGRLPPPASHRRRPIGGRLGSPAYASIRAAFQASCARTDAPSLRVSPP
ncbi:MAG: hypothetical protein F4Y57_10250 [Acidobacteria bacterium]|nr:hypothetical protein [Acidobacteriota bacterium]